MIITASEECTDTTTRTNHTSFGVRIESKGGGAVGFLGPPPPAPPPPPPPSPPPP